MPFFLVDPVQFSLEPVENLRHSRSLGAGGGFKVIFERGPGGTVDPSGLGDTVIPLKRLDRIGGAWPEFSVSGHGMACLDQAKLNVLHNTAEPNPAACKSVILAKQRLKPHSLFLPRIPGRPTPSPAPILKFLLLQLTVKRAFADLGVFRGIANAVASDQRFDAAVLARCCALYFLHHPHDSKRG